MIGNLNRYYRFYTHKVTKKRTCIENSVLFLLQHGLCQTGITFFRKKYPSHRRAFKKLTFWLFSKRNKNNLESFKKRTTVFQPSYILKKNVSLSKVFNLLLFFTFFDKCLIDPWDMEFSAISKQT